MAKAQSSIYPLSIGKKTSSRTANIKQIIKLVNPTFYTCSKELVIAGLSKKLNYQSLSHPMGKNQLKANKQ